MQNYPGLAFYPPEQIATLTPFLCGWWRAVITDGSVLHLPERPEGPWVQMGESWVLPWALQRSDGGGLDQAGFFYAGELKDRPITDCLEVPTISDLGMPAQAVWGLRVGKNLTWLTDKGEVSCPLNQEQARQLHPDLVQVTDGLYGNYQRFRSLRPAGDKFELVLDDGRILACLHHAVARKLAERLGLTSHTQLEPQIPGMLEYKLRDWPTELYTAEAEQLKAWFDDANVLIANCLLQAMRYRQKGIPIEYGDDHRGFWYKPISTVLYRAGFIDADQLRWLEWGEVTRESKDQACLRYRRMVERAVGDFRWFTYQELGFRDPGGRVLGLTRPHILFLVEKKCLEGYARKLAEHFGFTYLISGGATKLIDTEFLAKDLERLAIEQVELFSFADFDPEGTALTDGFVPQLERYKIGLKGPPKMVVHPSCFTERELRLFALPCPMGSSAARTLAQRWVERTGGIYGQAFGIGSDHLQPIERVIRRLEELGC